MISGEGMNKHDMKKRKDALRKANSLPYNPPTFIDGVFSIADLGGGYFDLTRRLKRMDDAISMQYDAKALREDADKAFSMVIG